MRKKKTPRKKTYREKLTKDLDDLCREYIKLRDNHTCVKCGKSGKQMHWSHVIPRSAGNRLRWDELNSKCLCAYCHRRWWHANPLEAEEWFKKNYPERYEYIKREKIKGPKRFSLQELEEMVEMYQKKISLLREAKEGDNSEELPF